MSQRRKNIVLVIGFFVLLFICHRLAFSKTFETRSQIKSLETSSVGLEEISNLSLNLGQRAKYADSVLSANNLKNTSVQNNLLSFLNAQGQTTSVVVSEFQEPHNYLQDDSKVVSYSFKLVGEYDDLLRVIYSLEQDYNFGEITHISFEKKRDYRRRIEYLEAIMVIENIQSL